MKTLIYQVCLGEPSRLYEWCTQSVEEYAKSIGADYIKQTVPILMIKPNPFLSGRSENSTKLGYLPIFEKENAFTYLKDYDRVCVIDADVYVRPDSPSIFDEPNAPFSACIEASMPITDEYVKKIRNYSYMQYHMLSHIFAGMQKEYAKCGYPFANMGVMLLDKSLSEYIPDCDPKKFLSRPEFEGFVNGIGPWKWSTDQTLLNYWVRAEKIKSNNLPWKWNGLYTANTRIKECHFVHFFLKDKLPERGENIEVLKGSI